jgi:competence CoiA-like predicted nuclease
MMSEGERHLSVKRQIAQALKQHPEVTDLRQEQPFGPVQADIAFSLRTRRVAVEIQQSDASWTNIAKRTHHYHTLGIHVLWVLVSDSPLRKGVIATVPMWQRGLHALYFGVIYYWMREQLLLPIHLQRCVNPNQQYYKFQEGRWHSPLYEHLRMPWLLDPVQITQLHPIVRSAAVHRDYTLPKASLLNLSYEALQEVREKSKQYLDYTRNHGHS